ncbi:MAG: arginine kinase [Proteobacteria bacterium]|nr:arginine kinase [Pseudomonadota bacterium]
MAFPQFHPDSCALVKQYLTPKVYEQLACLKTRTGFTLDAAIQSGLCNPDSHIGIYAGDAEAYSLFAPLLDPIVHAYHAVEDPFEHRPGLDPIRLAPLDPDKNFIVSSRIRVARNLKGFSFPCHIGDRERRQVEALVSQALQKMPREIDGSYFSFKDLDRSRMQEFLSRKLAFPKGDRFQNAAGINRNFPDSRGIFSSHTKIKDKQFMVWVNEEDHLRIISMEASSDLSGVFDRLLLGLDHLGTRLGFAMDEKYGFLTSCPTNIGTAMRAGVHICLKKLEKHPKLLNHLANQHHLQIRGTGGEKTSVDGAIFDISNKQRLGISESRILGNLHTGLAAILQAEKNL